MGGAEPWPRVHPGVLRGVSRVRGPRRAGLPACERRAAASGWQVALARLLTYWRAMDFGGASRTPVAEGVFFFFFFF